ncbi:hypothetical protein [Microbispora sp. NBC_01389]|uniref:hypothetical protein n=1 Tax=Microbispora sp. NBC_01389 TaxID=2903584 RepID=UPI00324F02D7
MSIFPLWIVAFISLQLVAGTDGPPPTPKTVEEAVAQYADVSTPGWIAWTLFASGILVLTSVAALWLGWAVRGLRGGGIAAWLGTAAVVAGVLDSIVTIYVTIGLKLSDPPSYPPLIEQFALGVESSKAWANPLICGLFTATVAVVAAIVWREKVLGRSALVIAVLGGVFTVLTIVIPVPLFAAILLLVLGVVLLRSRKPGSA